VIIYLPSLLTLELDSPQLRSGRAPNQRRDRTAILEWARALDDKMFRRQFRLQRIDFLYVLGLISGVLKKDEQKAINSSNSSIAPELMLYITLRILAGASYLDMIHYKVHIDSVSALVWTTCVAIHNNLNNKFYTDEDSLQIINREWNDKQKERWGANMNTCTVYAGDGLVVEILQPDVKALRRRAVKVFRNRKGFWGILAQGFCDSNTRFSVLDVKWPGGTNDIVAYPLTELYEAFQTGKFPAWVALVLDEAYSSIGGMHLTPFSIHQVRRTKQNDIALYYKMLAFNHILSSQRITIERAFGMLVRRWGILWKPISFELKKVPTIVRVCAMLHNVCVDRFVATYGHMRSADKQVIPQHDRVEEDMPEQDEIIERMHNNYVSNAVMSVVSEARNDIMHAIYDANIRTTVDTGYHEQI
jgi:hypothetical protein